MKKIKIFLLLFASTVFYAQSTGISYQAIIYNPNGEAIPGYNNANAPLANKNICLQFIIIDSALQTEYQEKITVRTDEYGMVNTVIGTGIQTGGYATSFANVNWSLASKSLKVGLDTYGICSNFIEISNQLFTSVPYAFAANSAENVTGVVPILNGGTGATTVLGAKINLVLENVDNTNDINKPISIATQAALNLKEVLANKSIDVTSDGTSDTKYPSVKSIKDYVDASSTAQNTALTNEANIRAAEDAVLTNKIKDEVTRATAAEDTKEVLANKSINVISDGTSDTKYPSVKSIKDYVDASSTAQNTALSNEANIRAAEDAVLTNKIKDEVTRATAAEDTKEVLANKSINVISDGTSDTKYPSVKSIKDYVDASSTAQNTALSNEANIRAAEDAVLTNKIKDEVTRATAAEDTKEVLANKSINVISDRASDTKYPSVKSIKDYVDLSITTATPDASTSVKGKLQLAGDLTGTADLPIIADDKIVTSKILNSNVTYAKIQEVTTGKILGRTSTGKGVVEEVATTGTQSVVLSDSPTLTGAPVLPTGSIAVTQSPLDKTTALATTEFVTSAIEVATIPDATTARKGKLQLAGDLTGTADLPIIADDKIVTSKILNSNVTYAKIQEVTTGKILGRTSTGKGVVEEVATTGTQSVVLSDSPTLTGAPVLPTGSIAVTQSPLDKTTALATTEFVTSAIEVATIPDATTARKGKLQLAGDLTGTADLPIIADDKIVTSKILNSNVTYAKIQEVTTGKILGRTSTGKGVVEEVATTGTQSVVLSDSPTLTGAPVLPTGSIAVTQSPLDKTTALATTEFVTSAIEVATIPDATTARKGKLQLAGDLTGTADLPIIADDKIVTSKILNSNVTYAKIQEVTTGKILGRTSTGNGVVEEVATTGTQSVVLSDSPTLTGAPVLPTGSIAVTQPSGNNSTAIATTEYVISANATNANLTGDVTSVGNATTLSSSGVTAGTYGNNLAIPVITVDSKGRITTLTTNLLSPSLQEESVEYTDVTDGQTSFTLSHTPSNSTLVRMYINGVLISQSANSRTGTTVTYNPTNNGSYSLTAGDRIQFLYYY